MAFDQAIPPQNLAAIIKKALLSAGIDPEKSGHL